VRKENGSTQLCLRLWYPHNIACITNRTRATPCTLTKSAMVGSNDHLPSVHRRHHVHQTKTLAFQRRVVFIKLCGATPTHGGSTNPQHVFGRHHQQCSPKNHLQTTLPKNGWCQSYHGPPEERHHEATKFIVVVLTTERCVVVGFLCVAAAVILLVRVPGSCWWTQRRSSSSNSSSSRAKTKQGLRKHESSSAQD
jgi:hypothetical protein